MTHFVVRMYERPSAYHEWSEVCTKKCSSIWGAEKHTEKFVRKSTATQRKAEVYYEDDLVWSVFGKTIRAPEEIPDEPQATR